MVMELQLHAGQPQELPILSVRFTRQLMVQPG